MLLVFSCLLTACGHIDYGTVTDKSYVPARQTYTPLIMVTNKQTHIIPRYTYHPESWQIYVQNDDGGEWWTVTQDYYNNVNIGDHVDRRTN